MLKAIIRTYKKYAIYRTTVNQLSALSDRELYDLGVDRSQIELFARESVYTEEHKVEFTSFFKDLFKVKTEKDKIDEYLSDSVSIVDLENRIKNMDRGQAPWQVQGRIFSQGWSQ